MTIRFTPEQWQAHQDRLNHMQREHNQRRRKQLDVAAIVKPTKYRNQSTVEDGIRFDSKKEAKRYRELGAQLRAGDIHWLARQVRFMLPGNTEYRADFVVGVPGGIRVEDVKSAATRKLAAYRIKFRQMKAIHGIAVVEI